MQTLIDVSARTVHHLIAACTHAFVTALIVYAQVIAGLRLALVDVRAVALVRIQSEAIWTFAEVSGRSHDTLVLTGVTPAQVFQAAGESVLVQAVTLFARAPNRLRVLMAQVFAAALVDLTTVLPCFTERTPVRPLKDAVQPGAHRIVRLLVATGNICIRPEWKCLQFILLRLL